MFSTIVLAWIESGSLSSVGVTRHHRYYGPIRHLSPPTLALTGSSLDSGLRLSTAADFPCCPLFMSRACCHHYPGETMECVSRSLPPRRRPSPLEWRVGSHNDISRPAQCSLTLRPARTVDPHKGHIFGVLQVIRCLLTRPEYFRLERELAGLGFHQGEQCALQGTHSNKVEDSARTSPTIRLALSDRWRSPASPRFRTARRPRPAPSPRRPA